jgi:Na+-driven multidrug efflux pump
LIFIGTISFDDPSVMAGVALGHMTKAILGSTILVGVNASIETFVSQAAGGKNYRLAGIYLNQGRIILCLMFLPIAMILLQTENLMTALG